MADHAATSPEAPIDVVGLLGGRPVGADACAALGLATLVVGSDDQLAAVDDLVAAAAERVPLGKALAGLDAVALVDGAGRPCVLASGDPGLFGIVGALGRRFGPARLRVHPAPSSVALAFARLGRPWQGARIVSAHARPIADLVAEVRAAPLAAVLVDPDRPPESVGMALRAAGVGDRRVWICSRLGEDGEAVTATDLAGLAAGTFDGRSVVVLEAVDATVDAGPTRPGWGRDVDAFAHRDGMITKPEVRSAVLGRLALPALGVLWDLGAGSGSVAIEAALASPGLRVIAVERRADDAERIRVNAARLRARVEVVDADALDVIATLPRPDRVFVGGGGLEVLDAARARVGPDGVVVATFAAADRAVAAHARLGNLSQLAVHQADVLPDGGVRLVADNPVFIAWGPGARVTTPPGPAPLVVGVGCSTTATAADALEALDGAVASIGRTRVDVGAIVTVDRRADHPALLGLATALDRPLRAFAEADLADVEVPNPSPVVAAHLATASVAEAAALLAAGPGATLVLPKARTERVTVAIAVAVGGLVVVGLGPGGAEHRTAAAVDALATATVVHGYGPYVDQCEDVLRPDQRRVRSAMGDEAARARAAVLDALAGERVAVVSSGDAGVFSMASVTLEIAAELAPELEVRVVPGVTAAHASAALVGAPLAGDHASISLSDRLRPWDDIASRIDAAAATDLALALYNPRSTARPWQLGVARDLVLAHRDGATPVAVVADAGRPGEAVTTTTLGELDPDVVGMNAIVLIGSSETVVLSGRLVTRRHHPRRPERVEGASATYRRRSMTGPLLVRGWPGTVRIVDGCTACGLCIQTCPEVALLRAPRRPAVVDDRCTGCLACIEVCPRDCIVEERNVHP